MSAGISVNKTMAKLAAGYGKPNGQALLPPDARLHILSTTKIRKLRHFGGKLGKRVQSDLLQKCCQFSVEQAEQATFGDLQSIPLPLMQSALGESSGQFVFNMSRGIDEEVVQESDAGTALVKSITAFKSFPATASLESLKSWLQLLANEIVSRVRQDHARHKRYPKTSTLSYSHYTTNDGKRPPKSIPRRSMWQSKSIRIPFPDQHAKQPAQALVSAAMVKVSKLVEVHPINRIGLAASNFTVQAPPPGAASVKDFFRKRTDPIQEDTICKARSETKFEKSQSSLITRKRPRAKIDSFFSKSQLMEKTPEEKKECGTLVKNQNPSQIDISRIGSTIATGIGTVQNLKGMKQSALAEEMNEDWEFAKELQAKFDREDQLVSRMTSNVGKSRKKPTNTLHSFFRSKG